MSRSTLPGVIGGGRIVLAAFVPGEGFGFNSDALHYTMLFVLAIAAATASRTRHAGPNHLVDSHRR